MYNVSITRLRVRSIWFLPLFGLHAMRSATQTMKSEGIVSFDTRVEDPFTHWTKTVWKDESSMKSFRNSGAHQLAMRLLAEICSEASYTRWQQETPDIPNWDEVHKAMLEKGILSKVKKPSPMHLEGHAAPPLV
ncbi:MAG: hypothetical protein OHK003_02710 [Anaerolineales bacterium]